MKHYHSGYDCFTPEPGKWGSKNCPICNELMEVERDREGSTSSIGAMFDSKHKYDFFFCKNAQEGWHVQVIKLTQEIQDTNSASLRNIIQKEIDEILNFRKPTLEKFHNKLSPEEEKEAQSLYEEFMDDLANGERWLD